MYDSLLIGVFIAVMLYGLLQIVAMYLDARADKRNYTSASDEERKEIEKTMESNPIVRAHAQPLGRKAIFQVAVIVAILLIIITLREVYG